MKQQNQVIIDISICKMKELIEKALFSSENKMFRADPNHVQEIQINCEYFVILIDRKFHLEIEPS